MRLGFTRLSEGGRHHDWWWQASPAVHFCSSCSCNPTVLHMPFSCRLHIERSCIVTTDCQHEHQCFFATIGKARLFIYFSSPLWYHSATSSTLGFTFLTLLPHFIWSCRILSLYAVLLLSPLEFQEPLLALWLKQLLCVLLTPLLPLHLPTTIYFLLLFCAGWTCLLAYLPATSWSTAFFLSKSNRYSLWSSPEAKTPSVQLAASSFFGVLARQP